MIFIFHSWIIHVNKYASTFLDSRVPLLNRWSTSLPRHTNSLWCVLPTALVESKSVGDKTTNAERHTLKHWKQLCCLLIPWWSLWIFGLLMIILHFCGLRIHGLLMHNTFRYSEGKIGTSPEVWDGQVLFRSSFTSFWDNLDMYPFSCMGLLLLRMKPQDTNSYPTKPFDQILDICVYLKSSFWDFQSWNVAQQTVTPTDSPRSAACGQQLKTRQVHEWRNTTAACGFVSFHFYLPLMVPWPGNQWGKREGYPKFSAAQ